jgi:hypothetical protein
MNRNFLITGLVRNQESNLENIVAILQNSFDKYGNISFLIIESDSTDKTIETLTVLRNNYANFDFVSLGKLEETIENRWVRMAILRNTYLEIFKNSPKYKGCNFLVVADLDDVNLKLKSSAIESIFKRNDWAAVFANQSKYYYDILALRHPTLSPNDCWKEERSLIEKGMNPFIARKRAVFDRQIKIPPNSPWLEVDSAFGGLAIYRRNSIKNCHYSEYSSEGDYACEHIDFHSQIRATGGKLFIVPSMINSGYVDHTEIRKVVPTLKWFIKLILWEFAQLPKYFKGFFKA